MKICEKIGISPATREARVKEFGFTLIELLIASTLALILMLTTTTILFQAVEFADKQRLRPVLNDKARAIFDLLGDGGCCTQDNIAISSRRDRFFGMRARKDFSAAAAGDLRGDGYRLQLDRPALDIPTGIFQSAQSFTPIGPEISDFTINCRGQDDPVQGCSANSSKSVQGFLARDPRLFTSDGDTDRSIDDDQRGLQNRTIEVEYLLIQPHQANRSRFRSDEIRESYRTIFTFNQSK